MNSKKYFTSEERRKEAFDEVKDEAYEFVE